MPRPHGHYLVFLYPRASSSLLFNYVSRGKTFFPKLDNYILLLRLPPLPLLLPLILLYKDYYNYKSKDSQRRLEG